MSALTVGSWYAGLIYSFGLITPLQLFVLSAVMHVHVFPPKFDVKHYLIGTNEALSQVVLIIAWLLGGLLLPGKEALKNILASVFWVISAISLVGLLAFDWTPLSNRSMLGAFLSLLWIFSPPGELRLCAFLVASLFLALEPSSTGALVLGGTFIAACIQCRAYITALFGGAFGVALFTAIPDPLGRSRFEDYRILLQGWGENFSVWVGSGAGTFMAYAPYFQAQAGERKQFWAFAHSDWLQLYLELGVIGLGAFVVGYCLLLWRARGDQEIFTGLVGVALCAVPYYPFHFPTHAVIAGMLMIAASKRGYLQERSHV